LFLDPNSLQENLPRLEGIEKGTIRYVAQAMANFREEAATIFKSEQDLAGDIGEDITREALDRVGVSKIEERLFGKVDYKRARYIFNNEYAVRQALFVDSKAEKADGTATIQTTQTSMRIRHIRAGREVEEFGTLPNVLKTSKGLYLVSTVFVHYSYRFERNRNTLEKIIVAGVPNGMLRDIYNPTFEDTIWRTGRNAPSRGEEFRVRLVFDKLKAKKKWRVQEIPMAPEEFVWDE